MTKTSLTKTSLQGPARSKSSRATKSTRTNLPTEARQDQILLAARRLFREKGYRGTSMQDIGDAVGLQKGSLYLHISSKEDLLFQIVDATHREIATGLDAIYQSQVPPSEKLRQAIKHHTLFVARNRDALWVLTEDARHLSPPRRKLIAVELKRYEDIFDTIIEDGIRSGEFRPVNTKITSFAVLGMCNWLYRWYSGTGSMRAEQIAEVLADLVLVSLTGGPATSPGAAS